MPPIIKKEKRYNSMRERVEMLEMKAVECLGFEEFCNAILQAMSSDEKLEMLEFIVRVYDIEEV